MDALSYLPYAPDVASGLAHVHGTLGCNVEVSLSGADEVDCTIPVEG